MALRPLPLLSISFNPVSNVNQRKLGRLAPPAGLPGGAASRLEIHAAPSWAAETSPGKLCIFVLIQRRSWWTILPTGLSHEEGELWPVCSSSQDISRSCFLKSLRCRTQARCRDPPLLSRLGERQWRGTAKMDPLPPKNNFYSEDFVTNQSEQSCFWTSQSQQVLHPVCHPSQGEETALWKKFLYHFLRTHYNGHWYTKENGKLCFQGKKMLGTWNDLGPMILKGKSSKWLSQELSRCHLTPNLKCNLHRISQQSHLPRQRRPSSFAHRSNLFCKTQDASAA